MIKPTDIPDEVVEAMQSCLHPLEPWVARRLAAAMINAWPGAETALLLPNDDWTTLPPIDTPHGIILPLPQKGDA